MRKENNMRQYETFELVFQGEALNDNRAGAAVEAEFACGENRKTVKGFYDGDGNYVVRFLPEVSGLYRWKVSGAVTAEGEALCEPAKEQHGIVKAVATHFEFEDGTLYYPFGTTVYALAHQDDEIVRETLESLQSAPFNKIRMCVFPKSYDYNQNEPPCFAFEKSEDGSWNVSRPDIRFWHRFEKILKAIGAMGIQVDLILFHPYDRWGLSALKQEENLTYLDYLLRRLSAFPFIWWSLANEYDLCAEHKSLADWEEIECYVAENDPYGHLLSNHNCLCFWDHARENITHASLQTKAHTQIPRWLAKYQKPIMIDECCYEGNLPTFWGSISAREMVNRFWRCVASGAYCTHGETFLDENDVIWWAKGGVLKGKSPKRIAFLRSIIESLPGPLEAEPNRFLQLLQADEESLKAILSPLPEGTQGFLRSIYQSANRMEELDLAFHFSYEHEWAAHCKEAAYLWFNDLQCYQEKTLELPADKRYRVEWIDTWEMTRVLAVNGASGKTTIRLPGKEGIAVLATRTDA